LGQVINELRRLVQVGQREYEFKFAAEVIDGRTPLITASCKIAIKALTVSAIEQYGGYNPTCFADGSNN
jgi:hypothetical protein